MTVDHLSCDVTSLLRHRCRENITTVQGVVTAAMFAFVYTMRSRQGLDTSPISSLIQCDLRRCVPGDWDDTCLLASGGVYVDCPVRTCRHMSSSPSAHGVIDDVGAQLYNRAAI